MIDIYGTSQECFAFDEFGENLSTSYNNTSQTFGFTGYQTDEVGDPRKATVYPAAATLAMALPALSGRIFTEVISIPGTEAAFNRCFTSSQEVRECT